MQTPDYLSLTEVSKRIGKSRPTVRKLIEDRLIAAYVDPGNGRLVVEPAECERYLRTFQRYVPEDE